MNLNHCLKLLSNNKTNMKLRKQNNLDMDSVELIFLSNT